MPTPEGVKTLLDDMVPRDPRAKAADPRQYVDMSFVQDSSPRATSSSFTSVDPGHSIILLVAWELAPIWLISRQALVISKAHYENIRIRCRRYIGSVRRACCD